MIDGAIAVAQATKRMDRREWYRLRLSERHNIRGSSFVPNRTSTSSVLIGNRYLVIRISYKTFEVVETSKVW